MSFTNRLRHRAYWPLALALSALLVTTAAYATAHATRIVLDDSLRAQSGFGISAPMTPMPIAIGR